MEINRAIMERRSIRKFKDQPVETAIINELISFATWAPSASNMQAWRFIIIQDRHNVEKIRNFSPGIYGIPPSIIIVCMDLEEAFTKGGKFALNELVYYDAALACQNIALSALEYGLGTCLVASFNKEGIKTILDLPAELTPFLMVTIGYPDKVPIPPQRHPLDQIIYKKGGE
jgi:nitroreductase